MPWPPMIMKFFKSISLSKEPDEPEGTRGAPQLYGNVYKAHELYLYLP